MGGLLLIKGQHIWKPDKVSTLKIFYSCLERVVLFHANFKHKETWIVSILKTFLICTPNIQKLFFSYHVYKILFLLSILVFTQIQSQAPSFSSCFSNQPSASKVRWKCKPRKLARKLSQRKIPCRSQKSTGTLNMQTAIKRARIDDDCAAKNKVFIHYKFQHFCSLTRSVRLITT